MEQKSEIKSGADRRKHKRFSATAFLHTPVYLSPLPPYFGHPVKGKLIDLSAGGLSVLIGEIIPQETFLSLILTFPDNSKIESIIKVRHAVPRGKGYLHGIEFLNPPAYMVEKIDKMSSDYIDCENRIQAAASEVCRMNCAFFTMCNKPQRTELLTNINDGLLVEFAASDPSTARPNL
jgi:hypothetical protein